MPYIRDQVGVEFEISEELILSVCEAWLEDWRFGEFLRNENRFRVAMKDMAETVVARLKKWALAVDYEREEKGLLPKKRPATVKVPAPRGRGYFLGDD